MIATRAKRPDLTGVEVLVVEDDFYLATDFKKVLSRCGAVTFGPYADPQEAIDRLEQERPHCALVDINLGAGPSFALADRLAALGVPFAFVTGYDQSVIPPRHDPAVRMEKPIEPTRVPDLVEELLGRQR